MTKTTDNVTPLTDAERAACLHALGGKFLDLDDARKFGTTTVLLWLELAERHPMTPMAHDQLPELRTAIEKYRAVETTGTL